MSRRRSRLGRLLAACAGVALAVSAAPAAAGASAATSAATPPPHLAAAPGDSPQCQLPAPSTFSYVGPAVQQCTVPAGVTSVTATVVGAQGGTCTHCGAGGHGGEVIATLAVRPGQHLGIWVGQQGQDQGGWGWPASGGARGTTGTGGYNGAGGGGSSGVAGTTGSTAAPLVVAGGGGGGGGDGHLVQYYGAGGAGASGGNPAGNGAKGGDSRLSADNKGYGGNGGVGGGASGPNGAPGESWGANAYSAGGGGGGGFPNGGSGGHHATSPYQDIGVYLSGGGGGGGGGGYSSVQGSAVAQLYTTATAAGNGSVTLSTATVVTKQCTEAVGQFSVPTGVTSIQTIAVGGQGGSGSHTGQPGFGAEVTATIQLDGQKELTYYVGCRGYGSGGWGYGTGGWQGSSGPFYDGEGGGGGTALLDGSGPLVVAGGGGGPGGNGNADGGNGGNGGLGPGTAGAGWGSDGSGSSPGKGGQGGANGQTSGQSGADGGYGGAGGGGGGGYTPPSSPGAEPGGGGLQGTNGSPEAAGGGGGGAGASYARPGVTSAVSYAVSGHQGGGFLTLIYQAPVPTHVTVLGGAGQHAVLGTRFAHPLRVEVTDQHDNPFPGVVVLFLAPANGPSVTFADGQRYIAPTTNSDGIAATTAFTANQTAGAFTVFAGGIRYQAHTSIPLVNERAATSTTITPSVPSPVVGQSVHLTGVVADKVAGPQAPMGGVQFIVDGRNLGLPVPADPQPDTSPARSRATSIAFTFTSAGTHTVSAVFLGSASYWPSSATATQTVGVASTTTAVSSSANPSAAGQPVTFTAKVSGAAPSGGPARGAVQFSVDGTSVGTPVQLRNGTATTGSLASLAVGSHRVRASFLGTSDYAASTGRLSQTVEQGSTATLVTSSVNPSPLGQKVTFTATVSALKPAAGTPTGAVQFVVDGTPLGMPVDLAAGVAISPQTASLTPGIHQVFAEYQGSSLFLASNGSFVQTVGKGASRTTSTPAHPTVVVGQANSDRATVTGVPAGGSPTGTVSFYLCGPLATPRGCATGGEHVADETLSPAGDAVATATSPAAAQLPGIWCYRAAYAGSATYRASVDASAGECFTVAKAPTATSLSAQPAAPVFGQPVTLTATVTVRPPGAGEPAGTVTFFDGARPIGTAALSDGRATLSTAALSVGAHTLTATYSGADDFDPSTSPSLDYPVGAASSSTTLSASPDSAVFGQPVALRARVVAAPPGNGTPTGTVTFKLGTTVLGAALLNGQTATITTAALPVGSGTVTAVYGGDDAFQPSTSNTVTVLVAPAATTTVVTATPTSTVFGQSVTVRARVSAVEPGFGSPAGSVVFTAGPTVLGTAEVDVSGTAILHTTGVPLGTNLVRAAYQGDADFTRSTSTAVTVTVAQASTRTTVSAHPTTSVFGQVVTVTVRITPVAPASGTPTGTVAFTVGTRTLAVDHVDRSGTVTLTTGLLPLGAGTLTATYRGDSTFTGSHATAPVTVTQAATSTVVSSTPAHPVIGDQATLVARVSPAPPGFGAPTGIVTFTAGSVDLGTAPVDWSGMATLVTTALGVGSNAVTATYRGDRFFGGSRRTTTVAVRKRASTTILSADPTSSTAGQAVTFTATVIAGDPPVGTVTFTAGGVAVGEAALDGAGTASITTSALAVGTTTVVARYGGDPTHAGSASAPLGYAVSSGSSSHGSSGNGGLPYTGLPLVGLLGLSLLLLAVGAGMLLVRRRSRRRPVS